MLILLIEHFFQCSLIDDPPHQTDNLLLHVRSIRALFLSWPCAIKLLLVFTVFFPVVQIVFVQ